MIRAPLTVAALAFAFFAMPAQAATWLWDSDGNASSGSPATSTPGGGTWNTTNALWYNGTTDVVWNSANTAVFGGADGTYAVGVASGLSAAGLTFNNSGYTLGAASPSTLTLTSGTPVTVAAGKTAVIGNNLAITTAVAPTFSGGAGGQLTFDSGSSFTVTGNLNSTVSGGMTVKFNTGSAYTVAGGGSLIIGGANAPTSTVIVNGGALTFAGNTLVLNNFTSANGDAVLTLDSGSIDMTSSTAIQGTLRYSSSSTFTTGTSVGTVNLNGGTLTVAEIFEGPQSGGTLTSILNLNGGTIKVKANTSLGSTFLTGLDTANVRNGGAKFDTNGVNITVGQALVHSTIGGDSATDGGLTKSGTGTLTLSGAGTFTGATTINAGTLTLSSTGTIDNSSGVAVASGATFNTSAKTSGYTVKGLSGAGTVVGLSAQALTLATGGVLAAGDAGIGTLTFTAGNLALADGTTLNYQIGGTTAVPTSDLVQLTGSGSTVTLTGTQTLLLANLGTVDPTGKTFTLFDSAASISIAGTWIIDYGSTGWTGGSVSLASGNVVLSGLSVSAIPEPSTSAALLGVAVLGLGLLRRRRQPLIA